MSVTFKGSPVTLLGKELKVGDTLPDFVLVNNALEEVKSSNLSTPLVLVAVPSLDTSVCDMEVRNFNAKAGSLPGVHIYAVSMDLPFAQARWCGSAGVEAVETLSDYRLREFGEATGTYVKELGLLARAVFVIDKNKKVVYAEYVPEIGDQPNYDAIYSLLQGLV